MNCTDFAECDDVSDLKLRTCKHADSDFKTQPRCFAGSAVVDWLVFTQLALTRVEALTLASALLEEGFLRTVGLKSAEALRSGGLSEQFLDDSTALYSFVSSSARLSPRRICSEN